MKSGELESVSSETEGVLMLLSYSLSSEADDLYPLQSKYDKGYGKDIAITSGALYIHG